MLVLVYTSTHKVSIFVHTLNLQACLALWFAARDYSTGNMPLRVQCIFWGEWGHLYFKTRRYSKGNKNISFSYKTSRDICNIQLDRQAESNPIEINHEDSPKSIHRQCTYGLQCLQNHCHTVLPSLSPTSVTPS